MRSPLIQNLMDHDLWQPPRLPPEIVEHELYQQAVDEGWHEWIETPLDFEAVKQGYIYDLSRCVNNKPAFWFDGHWVLHDGTEVPMDDEAEHIGYVGRGDAFMRFAEGFLYHTKDPLTGQPYRFLPWMRRIVAPLFGWTQDKKGKYRRYQNLIVEIPKKNAKSSLMSVIALYCMYAEGTPKAYVFSCACDRNQAKIIYDESKNYVLGSPELREVIEVVDSRGRLVHQPSGSYYAVLSADAHRNDGIDSYITLVDEIHRHRDRRLYTVMKRAGRARPQKLLAVITTYGPSLTDGSIWAEVHQEAKAILAGQRPDAWRHLCFIASAEEIPVVLTAPAKAGDTVIEVNRLEQSLEKGTLEFDLSELSGESGHKVEIVVTEDAPRFGTSICVEPLPVDLPIFSEAVGNKDWQSDHAIRRANPAVDQIFPLSEIRKDINEARSPEAEAEMKQLSLNIVSGGGRKWISAAAWQSLTRYQVQPRNLLSRRCFGGLDLSFANDLTAFALAFPSWDDGESYESVDNPRLDLLVWAWVPSFAIDEREEKEKMPYRYYAKQDYLITGKGPVRICEGSTIDYAQVVQEVKEIVQHFEMRCMAFDERFAQFCRPQLEEAGMLMVAHRQGPGGMAPACKRFHEAVYNGILAHGDNPILNRAIEGAQLAPPNRDGLTYVTKAHSLSRIDPAVAAIMAVHFAYDPPEGTGGYVSIFG
jgi:phage terminase large subunit-like protein